MYRIYVYIQKCNKLDLQCVYNIDDEILLQVEDIAAISPHWPVAWPSQWTPLPSHPRLTVQR